MEKIIIDKERRSTRLNKLFRALNNEETDIISDYETEYGQPDHWNKEVQAGFDLLIEPVQTAKNQIYTLLKSLEKEG